MVQTITYQGYALDLNDEEIARIGYDSFLISYALLSISDYCIVTTEVSKPSKQRANKHIPDVCAHFGITCCNPFFMNKELDFRTNWGDNSE